MPPDLLAQAAAQPQTWLTLALIAVAVVFYVGEWLSLELTSLLLLVAVLALFVVFPTPLLGHAGRPDPAMLDAGRLLAGFGNPALLTVLALLVAADGLARTGALEHLAAVVERSASAAWAGLLVMLVLVAALSAFLNNTPVVVIFLPLAQALADRFKLPASQVMMPLSFAAILGGMTTLVGSSTNLLVSDALAGLGQPRLGFFEFSALGVLLAVIGLAYVVLVMPRLLRVRRSAAARVMRGGQQFISQIVLPADSPLIGKTAAAGRFEALPDVTVRLILRGERAVYPPFDHFVLRAGDVLVLAAPRDALGAVAGKLPGHLHPPVGVPGQDRGGDRLDLAPEAWAGAGGAGAGGAGAGGAGGPVGAPADATEAEAAAPAGRRADPDLLVEAMVVPTSRLVGISLEQYGFHQRFGCVAIGVLRRARMVRHRMTDIRLEAGDVLLVLGPPARIDALRAERDLVVVSGSRSALPRRDKTWTAGLLFGGALVLSAAGLVPIVVAAIAAAALMIAFGVLNLRQAVRAIDRKIVLVVAASLALGEALTHTGGALLVAHGLLGALGEAPAWVVLSLFYLLVAVMTNLLSNNACAVLFTPIGLGLGAQLGVDPRLFAIAVVMAANCSFASPVGYKTNLLVMGPGQYTFADFLRAGLPLVVVQWLAFTALAPLFWQLPG